MKEFRKKIAAIIPTLNEEKGIAKVIKSMPNPVVSDIIVVDASLDDTAKIAESLGAKVLRATGEGKGSDFRFFLDNYDINNNDVYVMFDGDCTYDPKELEKLIKPILNNEADVVMGWRLNGNVEEGAMDPTTEFGNRFLTFAAKFLYWKWDLRDLCTGYWAFSKDFLEKADVTAKGFDLEANLFAQAVKNNFRIKGVYIHYGKRVGEKKLKMRDGFKILLKLLRERF